jgi:hypothetical protein
VHHRLRLHHLVVVLDLAEHLREQIQAAPAPAPAAILTAGGGGLRDGTGWHETEVSDDAGHE